MRAFMQTAGMLDRKECRPVRWSFGVLSLRLGLQQCILFLNRVIN